jgi:CRISPR type III-B/RAMP module RAMP protein Cmr6
MLAVTKRVEAALQNGCDAWQLQLDKLSFRRNGEASAKTDSLIEVCACYAQRSARHLIEVCRSRQRLLTVLQRQHGTRFATVELILESKLLLHLGRANVLENVGLCADRTTGLPLIPGTALKGVLSTWACWEANQQADGSFNQGNAFVQERKAFGGMAQRIFGDDSEDGSEGSGAVIFVGGFPSIPPRLGLDIVNPHHETNGAVKKNLTPNAFLCVEPGKFKWHFAFYVRPGVADAENLLKATSNWLTQALTQLGIGAKTAAGYGRFRPLSQRDLAAQAQESDKAKALEAAAMAQAKAVEQRAKQQAAAQTTLKSDYPNAATYKNAVLRLADNPGEWAGLQGEIEKLKKPENALWLARFRKDTASRDYRKLRGQPWYPK